MPQNAQPPTGPGPRLLHVGRASASPPGEAATARGLPWQVGLFLAAYAVTRTGDLLAGTALLWWLLTDTGSAGRAALLPAVAGLVGVLAGPLGGTIADRVGRRTAALVSDGLRALLYAAMAVLAAAGELTLPRTLAGVVLARLAGGPYEPALFGLVPELAGPSRLERVNGWMEAVTSGSALWGPALAGLAYTAWGLPVLLALNAGSFLVSAAVLLITVPGRRAARAGAPSHLHRGGQAPAPALGDPSPRAEEGLRPRLGPARVAGQGTPESGGAPPGTMDSEGGTAGSSPATRGSRLETPDPSGRTGFWHDLWDGWRLVRRDTLLSYDTAVGVSMNFFIPMIVMTIPVLAWDRFGGDPRVYGVLQGALPLGMAVGARLAEPLLGWCSRGERYLLIVAAPLPLLLLLPVAPHPLAAGAALVLAGTAFGLSNVYVASTLQRRIPATHRARAWAVLLAVQTALAPVGQGLAGLIADHGGVNVAVAVATGGAFTSLLLTRRLPGYRVFLEALRTAAGEEPPMAQRAVP